MRQMAAAAAILMLAGGCSADRAPFEVGVKEVPTDVVLGAQLRPGTAPPPPADDGLAPGFPGFLQPPAPFAVLPPTQADFTVPDATAADPVPVACPESDPFAAPRHQARTRVTAPPPPGTYGYRNQGTLEVGGRSTQIAGRSTRTVQNVRRPDGQYTFSFEVAAMPGPTVTTYGVISESSLDTVIHTIASNAGEPAPTAHAGIYITRVVTPQPNGLNDVFEPVPAVKVAQFPFEAATQWESTGVDPRTQTVMSIRARVGVEVPDVPDPDTLPDLQGKARIDACGTPLEAWYVEVVEGSITTPASTIGLTALYAIAPQFGGLSVFDRVRLSGRERTTTNEATIESEPRLAE